MKNRIAGIILSLTFVMLCLTSCGTKSTDITADSGPLFISIASNNTGIELSEYADFSKTALSLSSPRVELENITKNWILNQNGELGSDERVYNSFAVLDQTWGEHNGKNYIAYTFGVRNADKTQNSMHYRVTFCNNSDKGIDDAMRVMVFRNGVPTIYAKPSASDGSVEAFEADKSFLTDDIVFEEVRSDFKAGETDRYSVVIWLEGEDPDCVNRIMGAEARFSMQFEAFDRTAVLS